MQNKAKIFLKSFIVLASGGFISKVLGAVYRIPLLNIIGSEALGIYQLIFPLYSLLLVISSAALPILISKKVAEYYAANAENLCPLLVKKYLALYSIIGILASILMAILSRLIAGIQGELRAAIPYVALSPSIFLVCIISVYRGYFQGREKMSKTAISQILEQVIKLGFGLFFAKFFMPNIQKTVVYLALAITISEVVAAIYLAISYAINKEKTVGNDEKISIKTNMKGSILITIGGIILPLSQIIDSVLVVNILSGYMDNAVNLYGILSGGVMSIVNLPIGIVYALAVSLLPRITREKSESADKIMQLSINLTIILSTFFTAIFMVFAEYIIRFLYSLEEINTMIYLTRALSPSILLLSLTQTLAYSLYARNRLSKPAIALACGMVVKIVANILLLNIQSLNIFASVISANLCYLVALIVNLVYIIKSGQTTFKIISKVTKSLFLAFSICGICYLLNLSLLSILPMRISLIVSLVVCLVLYFMVLGLEVRHDKYNRSWNAG